jgi:hypothetical protein
MADFHPKLGEYLAQRYAAGYDAAGRAGSWPGLRNRAGTKRGKN